MVLRYVQVCDILGDLESSDVDGLSWTTAENRKVEILMKKLKNLESINKLLQDEGTTMSDVWAMVDHTINVLPSAARKLSTDSNIVHLHCLSL